MKNPFKVALRAGERIYINGAVIACDRKVCIEFLNEVNFLLENHVMQPQDATTPLRQLYFIIQVMLMSPHDVAAAKELYRKHLPAMFIALSNQAILSQVKDADRLVHEGRYYEAMKSIRSVFALETEVISSEPPSATYAA